ncbi:MAG TPA: alpha/beta hydrolase [Terracidiphilus sp.]|jgi:pimeloyl-ACP methyl ester carboxylesterase
MHILLLVPGCFLVLIVLGCLYQRIGARRDRQRYTNTGRCVDIGDEHRIFLVEKGAGPATVLFESGIAATHLNWCHIQESVSRFACTVSYDRCGLGWSSACRTERTPTNVAEEFHAALEVACIKPPYVLVGHSFGGMVMRRFALLYSDEVAGIVLIDPMRCNEWPPLNPARQPTLNRAVRLSGYAIPIAHLGLARLAVTSALCRSGSLAGGLANAAGNGGRYLLGRVTGELAKMPIEIRPIIAAHWSRPDYYAGMRSHIKAVPETVREMCSSSAIEDIPVVVLTPGQSTPLSENDLSRIGNNTQQVIATESAHWIHLDQPDLVVEWILEMVLAADPGAISTHGLMCEEPVTSPRP